MAFGAELKDFVAGFQAGYKMIDSPEEKASKRAAEARAQGNYDRQGQWHEEDRADRDEDREYRRGRDAESDRRYDENQSWQKFRAGQEYELELKKWDELRKSNELRRADQERRTMGGEVPDIEAPSNPYGEDGPAIPDGTENPPASDETSSVTPSAYLSGDPTARLSGPQAAVALVSDLQSDLGLPRHVAIGITGALAGETGGFTAMQEKNPMVAGSRGGYGYAQWTGPRRRAFEHYAGDRVDEYGANYGFLKKEMTSGPESGIMDKLRGARTAQEAQRIFTDNFLRPGIPNYQGRAGWTNTIERGLGGGRAVSAARGGLIEEEHKAIPDGDVPVPMSDPRDEPEGAIPDNVPAPMPRPEYDGADSEPDADSDDQPVWKTSKDPYEAGRDAVREGMKKAMKDAGDTGDGMAIEDPAARKVHEAYIRGYGAAPRQMMKQVIDKIDPKREMNPGERNMLAMGTVYKYYMDQGDTEKAQAAAASMLQYYRQQSQQFLALGQAAAEKGDYDNAMKAAIAAYANIPNGRDFQVQKNDDGTFNISVTDAKSGKVVNRKVMSPQDFGAAAMQFNPATFDDEILNAAGVKPDKFETQTPEALANVEANTGTEVDTAAETAGETNAARIATIKDIATSIAGTQENGMGPAQAARFAQKLASLNADDPTGDKVGFSAKPVRGNPDRVRVTVDGQTVVMSKNALAALTGTVTEMKKEAVQEKADTDASTKWKADTADKFKKSVDLFRQGNTERRGQMEEGAAAIEEGRTAGDLGTAVGSMVPKRTDEPAIPDTTQEAIQPDVTTDERGAPVDDESTQQVINNLLSYRRQLMRTPDNPRAQQMLRQVEGRLNQLGYKE